MAELVLLSFDRVEILKLHCAANAGDGSALEFLQTLWQDYRATGVLCFLCDSGKVFPPFAQVIGDLAEPSKAIGAPVGADCRALPTMVR